MGQSGWRRQSPEGRSMCQELCAWDPALTGRDRAHIVGAGVSQVVGQVLQGALAGHDGLHADHMSCMLPEVVLPGRARACPGHVGMRVCLGSGRRSSSSSTWTKKPKFANMARRAVLELLHIPRTSQRAQATTDSSTKPGMCPDCPAAHPAPCQGGRHTLTCSSAKVSGSSARPRGSKGPPAGSTRLGAGLRAASPVPASTLNAQCRGAVRVQWPARACSCSRPQTAHPGTACRGPPLPGPRRWRGTPRRRP